MTPKGQGRLPQTAIRGGWLVSGGPRPLDGGGDLLITGDRITSVSRTAGGIAARVSRRPSASPESPAGGPVASPSVLDAQGCLVTPGLINAHLHLGETYLRGRVKGLSLPRYIEFSAESYRDPLWRELGPALHRTSARQTLVESALAGVSTICAGRGWDELREVGLRGLAGYPVWKCAKLEDYYRGFPADFDRLRRKDDDRVQTAIYLQSPLDLDPEAARAVAARLGQDPSLRFYIHIAETTREVEAVREAFGCSPFELLDRYGLLGPQAILVHCVHGTEKDMRLVADSGAGVVLCPTSNAKLGVGRPPIGAWFRAAGPRVAIGTDGLATNDSASVLETLKFAALWAADPAVDGRTVFQAATVGAAEVLGLGRMTGRLEEGLAADVGVWKPFSGGAPPVGAAAEDLVYNSSAYALRHLIVGGRPIVLDGRLQTADPDRTFAEMREAAGRLFRDAPATADGPDGAAAPAYLGRGAIVTSGRGKRP